MKYTNRDVKEFRNYVIECYSYETQYNWGHIVEIYHKDDPLRSIVRNKITYYNRTWECYRYQSCILGAIDNLIKDRKDELIADYKLATGKTKMKQQDKYDYLSAVNDPVLNEYNEMYEHFKSEYKSFI